MRTKITVFIDDPTAYDERIADGDYMDYPYEVTRQDERGTVNRASFRYLGDALVFVTCIVERELNQCLWRVKNTEQNDRLCYRVRCEAGRCEVEMDGD